MFLRSGCPIGQSRILYDQTGSGKSKMAASKLEIRRSQLVHKIAMKFQRPGYTFVFGVQLCNGISVNVARPNGKKPEVENPRGLHVNLKYVYLSVYKR